MAAIVPLVSGIPQSRNLGLVSLGVMALAGQLFVDVATARKPGPLTTFQRILLRIAMPHPLDPVSRRFTPVGDRQSGQHADVGGGAGHAADFGSAPELAEQHLYVINPPGALSFMGGLFQRLFTDKPFPVSINYLSSGFAPVHIERVDAQTIIVTPDGGYTPLPGPIVDDKTGMVTQVRLENVYRALDGFHYNPRHSDAGRPGGRVE